eukprot:3939037-Rhodomonas_salina.1
MLPHPHRPGPLILLNGRTEREMGERREQMRERGRKARRGNERESERVSVTETRTTFCGVEQESKGELTAFLSPSAVLPPPGSLAHSLPPSSAFLPPSLARSSRAAAGGVQDGNHARLHPQQGQDRHRLSLWHPHL